MDTPFSSSELHQVRTKTEMPPAASSFTGLSTLDSDSFQPSFGAQYLNFPGKSSEFQSSPRSARSEILGSFAYHSETPAQTAKVNADSGMSSFLYSGMLSDSVGSVSDIASISWKEYLPEITEEASMVNLGESNVQNKSKEDMFTFGGISEVEKPDRLAFGDDINLKDQFQGFYGMPRTNSTQSLGAQSFGSIFNFQESVTENTQEGSKLGEKNMNKDNLFSFGTVGEGENTESLSFSHYFNGKDQFGGSHAMPQKSSMYSLGAQSFGPGFSTGTGGDNLSFENYMDLKDQSSHSYETPVASSIPSFDTKSLGSGLSFGEYLPETSQEFNAGKLGDQFEKLGVQNLSNNGSLFGTGYGGEKTESLLFTDYINPKYKSDEAIGMSQTNFMENLGTQSLGTASKGEKIEGLKGNINFGDRFNEFYEMPPTNSTQSLATESILSSLNLDDYLSETTKEFSSVKLGEQFGNVDANSWGKEDLFNFNGASEGEGTRFTPFEKGTDFSSPISTGSSFQSPIGGFAFTRKYGGSEAPKKEIKGPRYRYIKVHEKGERKTQAKKTDAEFSSEREFTSQDFSLRSEKKFGDYEPMYTPYNDLLQGSSSGGYAKTSEEKQFNFGESFNFKPENFSGDASYTNLRSETTPLFSASMGDSTGSKFSFSDASYLDPNLFTRNSETTPLYSSFTGVRKIDGPSFSGSKVYNEIPLPVSESHCGQKNMSKLGHSSFTVRSARMQFEGAELLKSFSFPSGPSNRLRNEEAHELPNFGKHGTARSAGIHNDGEKWHERGNEGYKKGDMKSAEEFYSRGIKSLSVGETYQNRNRSLVLCYSNRAAARMSLGQIREAFSDCLAASKIEPDFPKVQLQIANCLLALGDLEKAIKQFNKCLESNNYANSDPLILSEASRGLHKTHKVLEYMSLTEDLMKWNSDQVSKALDLISDALSICSHSDKLMEMKATALLKLRRYEEAIQYCEQSPDSDGKDYISKQWKLNIIAKSYFYLGKLEEALEVVMKNEQAAVDSERYESDSSSSQTEKEVELDENKSSEPDSSFIVTLRELVRLKAAGNEAFHAGRYSEAVEHYTAACSCSMESRFFTAVCLCNRAAAYQALGQIVDAIADCSVAIALDPTYPKAFSRRAGLYSMIRDYDQAANDLRMLISLLEKRQQENQAVRPSKTNISDDLDLARRRLLSAEESAMKRIPLNLYLIFGLEESASVDDVKKAYKKAALRHHPDKAIQSLAKNEKVDGDAIWIEVTGRVHKDADHLFKIIGEAYAVLSDTTKRAKYDRDEEKRHMKKTHSAASTPRNSPSFR